MWREFVEFAERREESFSAICARFGVSRKTGYKWLKRFRIAGVEGLVEQSRRPKNSPRKIPRVVEEQVFDLRRTHRDWSAARISAELKKQGVSPLPAPSTIDLILRRRRERAAGKAVLGLHGDATRFAPNYRWSLRFGREIRLDGGGVGLPVMARDDNTHFVIGIALIPATSRGDGLTEALRTFFRRHGLPWRMALPGPRSHSALTVWLMRLGVGVDFVPDVVAPDEAERQQLAARLAMLPSYQRAALERTLSADPFAPLYRERGLTLEAALAKLERMREQQNFQGRQEGLQTRSPISLYRPSTRAWPDIMPALEYAPGAEVRLVSEKGIFTFRRRLIHVGRVFAGLEVELRPLPTIEHYLVLFAEQVLGQVDLSETDIEDTTSLPLQEVAVE